MPLIPDETQWVEDKMENAVLAPCGDFRQEKNEDKMAYFLNFYFRETKVLYLF